MKKIICLYGGPGSGKSTTCAGLFYKLKNLGFDCEMNREYVKEWCWEDRVIKPGDQSYFFAKQARKERLYMDKDVEFIITDSPLVLTHFYGMKFDPYEQKFNTSLNALKAHHDFCKSKGYKVDHFLLTRDKNYNPNGRLQSESEARNLDHEIVEMLGELNIKYKKLSGSELAVDEIIAHLGLKK